MVKVETTSRTTIKPFSQTPPALRIFNLSVIEQIAIQEYIPIILYYQANDIGNAKSTEISDRLKQSQLEALVRFCPLAGRIRENTYIESNDEGVDYLEANVDCPLLQFLEKAEADALDHLLLSDYHCRKFFGGVQLAVQVNHFTFQGIAIGICFFHKIVDGSTMGFFINSWAAIARGDRRFAPPKFIGSSLFPPRDLPGLLPKMVVPRGKCITKRFLFDGSIIGSLRERVTRSSSVPEPTRFQVVSAPIWKCKIEASRERLGSLTTSLAVVPRNLRPRMDPPLPPESAGNILWPTIAQATTVDDHVELHYLVEPIRDAVKKFDRDCVMKMKGDDGFEVIMEFGGQSRELFSKSCNVSWFTSWCRFPFYDADFGWGMPAWISSANLVFPNSTILLDEQDMG